MNKSISKMLSVILTCTSLLTACSNVPARCVTTDKKPSTTSQKVRNFLSSATPIKILNILSTTISYGASIYSIYGALRSKKIMKNKKESIENMKNLGGYIVKINTSGIKKEILNDVFKDSIKDYFCDSNRILLCGVPNDVKYTVLILGMSGDKVVLRKLFLNTESKQEDEIHTINLDDFATGYLDICLGTGATEIDIIGSSAEPIYFEYCEFKKSDKFKDYVKKRSLYLFEKY